jgi:hypothetical protein
MQSKTTQTNTKKSPLNFDDWCFELVTSLDVSDVLPATVCDSDAVSIDTDSLSLHIDTL